MRVAHFIHRYPPALGGSEAYFHRLGQFLADRGHRVSVWTTTAFDLEAFWSPAGRTLPAGENRDGLVTVRRFPLWQMRGRRWLLKPLSLFPQRSWQALTLPCNPISFAMRRAVAECSERFDAVHATAFPYAWPIVCARRLARRLGVPFLLTPFLHLGDPTDQKDRTRRAYTAPPLRALLRSADVVFVQTPSEWDAVRRNGVPEERLVLQGLGVEPAECTGGDRNRARQSWHAESGEIIVGHLANNSIEKGTVDLIRAAEILWARGHRFRLVLAGPEMPNFRRFMADRPEDQHIIRIGLLSEQGKRDFFAGIDFFALPSRSDSFGLVILEAWANGVPSVVSRAGGPADLVRHGIDGLQATCGDVNALAEQIERMILDDDLRRDCGAVGRARLDSEFRWEEKLQIVCEKLKSVIGSHASPKSESAAAKRG